MAQDPASSTNNNTIYHIRGYKVINGSVQNIDCNIQASREQTETLIKTIDISIESQEIAEDKGIGNNITATLETDNIQLYRSHQDVAKAAYALMTWGFPLREITDTNKPLSSAQSDRLIQKVKTSIEKNNNDTMQKNEQNGASQKENQENIVRDSNTKNKTVETTNTEITGQIVENETEGTNDWLETIQQRQQPKTKGEPTNTTDDKEITLENIQSDSKNNDETQTKTENENNNIQTVKEGKQENDQEQVGQTTGEMDINETRTNSTNRNQVAENLISDLQTFVRKASPYSLSSIPYLQQQQQQLEKQLSTGEIIQQRQIETLMQQMEQGELELIKLQQQQEIAQDIKTGNFKQEKSSKSDITYNSVPGTPPETIGEKKGIRSFLTHTIKWTIIVATLESGLITYRYMLQQNSLGEGPSAMIILGRIGLGYSGRTVVKKNKKMPIQILALVLTIAIVYLIISQIQKQL